MSSLAGNQKGFGEAIAASTRPTVRPVHLWICEYGRVHGFDSCKKATAAGCATNTQDLGSAVGTLDMIMLDYPAGDCPGIKGQWAAFEEMLKTGHTEIARDLEFSPQQIDCLLETPGVTAPAVNQLYFNVGTGLQMMKENFKRRGIVVQAYSPLKSGNLVNDATLAAIGKKYKKSAAQVTLKWILQHGAVFTTSMENQQEFTENLALFDFKLSPADLYLHWTQRRY